jgi:hypothetical protein
MANIMTETKNISALTIGRILVLSAKFLHPPVSEVRSVKSMTDGGRAK